MNNGDGFGDGFGYGTGFGTGSGDGFGFMENDWSGDGFEP